MGAVANSTAHESVAQLARRLNALTAELTTLRMELNEHRQQAPAPFYAQPSSRTAAKSTPLAAAFLAASNDPLGTSDTLHAMTARGAHTTPIEVARLALSAAVGRVSHRRALRALAVRLLDRVLADSPRNVDALCLKGEALLPFVHYGKNDAAPYPVVQEAFSLFDRAAKEGSMLALFLKGRCLLSTDSLHRDAMRTDLGRQCVRTAAEANLPRALVFLAHCYEYPQLDRGVSFGAELPKGKAARERFILNLYMRAANSGDPDALNDIGTSYAEGYGGLECDFDKAVEYYVRAIDKGSLHAFDNLGTHYETGMGGRCPERIDFQKALHYYRKGARQRCPKCAYNLAAAHEEGMKGALERNTLLAEKYYKLSVNLADDGNDTQTALRALKDLVSLYLTRMKLNHPDSQAVSLARKRVFSCIGDEEVIARLMTRLNRAIGQASKGKSASLSKLIGDVNCKLITNHIKELDSRIKAGGSPEDVILLNHTMGHTRVLGEHSEVQETARRGRKRVNGSASRSRKKRRT